MGRRELILRPKTTHCARLQHVLCSFLTHSLCSCTGMMENTRAMQALFITGGTGAGIMKYVGEARAKYNPMAPLIGIVPMGPVNGKH